MSYTDVHQGVVINPMIYYLYSGFPVSVGREGKEKEGKEIRINYIHNKQKRSISDEGRVSSSRSVIDMSQTPDMLQYIYTLGWSSL